VLRRIFGPAREELAGYWRRLREVIHNLYASPNIVTEIKSRMRWAVHVARMGWVEKCTQNFGLKS
jgi:hypothetical protein